MFQQLDTSCLCGELMILYLTANQINCGICQEINLNSPEFSNKKQQYEQAQLKKMSCNKLNFQTIVNFQNQGSNILNQIPAQAVSYQIENLANDDHSKQKFQNPCEFEILQNFLGVKSNEGEIFIQINKESLSDQTVLFQKDLQLDFWCQTEFAQFRMKTTSPVLITLTVESSMVAIKNESEAAVNQSKKLEEGRAIICFQVFQIIDGEERKSKVFIFQKTSAKITFKMPSTTSFLYFSLGLIGASNGIKQKVIG